MGKKIKPFLFALIMLAMISIGGCGFKPRHPSDLPPQLHFLRLCSPRPEEQLPVMLKRTLQALHVRFTKHATIILKLSKVQYTYANPNISSTIYAVQYPVTLTVSVFLLGPNQKVILPSHSISVSRVVILNANQVLVPNILREAAQDLTREAVNLIYYWLISENTKQALNQYERTNHANKLKKSRQSPKK